MMIDVGEVSSVILPVQCMWSMVVSVMIDVGEVSSVILPVRLCGV